jgi:hypothetical protein
VFDIVTDLIKRYQATAPYTHIEAIIEEKLCFLCGPRRAKVRIYIGSPLPGNAPVNMHSQ